MSITRRFLLRAGIAAGILPALPNLPAPAAPAVPPPVRVPPVAIELLGLAVVQQRMARDIDGLSCWKPIIGIGVETLRLWKGKYPRCWTLQVPSEQVRRLVRGDLLLCYDAQFFVLRTYKDLVAMLAISEVFIPPDRDKWRGFHQ